jgi:triosephosphate isomerase
MVPNSSPKKRGVIIAGNWKMNHGPHATVAFFESYQFHASPVVSEGSFSHLRSGTLQAWIVPPAISLPIAVEVAAKANVTIGAQNAHGSPSGAFTGELSASMLAEIGVKTALLGHSERRQFFGETNEGVKARAAGLLAEDFRVMVCIGETRSERESERTFAVLESQLAPLMTAEFQSAWESGRILLAYEPVWAIGTGLTATPEQAQEVHAWIRKQLAEKLSARAAQATPILYGGSVTPQNAASLLGQNDIDGALIGGASLKAESFLQLIEAGGKTIG